MFSTVVRSRYVCAFCLWHSFLGQWIRIFNKRQLNLSLEIVQGQEITNCIELVCHVTCSYANTRSMALFCLFYCTSHHATAFEWKRKTCYWPLRDFVNALKVHISTIYRPQNRFQETGIIRDHQIAERPLVLTAHQQRQIILAYRRQPFRTAMTTSRETRTEWTHTSFAKRGQPLLVVHLPALPETPKRTCLNPETLWKSIQLGFCPCQWENEVMGQRFFSMKRHVYPWTTTTDAFEIRQWFFAFLLDVSIIFLCHWWSWDSVFHKTLSKFVTRWSHWHNISITCISFCLSLCASFLTTIGPKLLWIG